MAYRDGTGPEGMGPMTGRGLGNCIKEEGSSNYSTGYYRGCGMGRRGGGRGMGRGMGRGFYQPVDRQDLLKNEKEILKSRLAEIENIIEKNE